MYIKCYIQILIDFYMSRLFKDSDSKDSDSKDSDSEDSDPKDSDYKDCDYMDLTLRTLNRSLLIIRTLTL